MTVEFKPANIPEELRERDQWLLWDASHDTPRQPHWAGEFRISWSDPDDWHSFDEAVKLASRQDSWGIGYVMALDNDDHPRGLYGCLDLDGCLSDDGTPKDWLPELTDFIEDDGYIERSPSGDGLHIPLVGQQAPDWWADSHFSDDEHEGVEFLTNKFVTFTGDILFPDELEPEGVADTNPAPFLFDAYETLNGESPRFDAEDEEYDEDRDWNATDVEELLGHIDSDCGYEKWRNIAFAVHDWDDGHSGKNLFETWSRGSGWDEDSQRLIDAIWSGSQQGSGVTFGTLVYHAKQAGWEPEHADEQPARPNNPGENPTEDADAEEDELSPQAVAAEAKLGEDESISDLTDREKAACVWEIVVESNAAHVRVRRDNSSLWAYDDGIWRPEGERELAHAARQALGAMNYGQNVLAELKAQARSDPRVEVEADEFGLGPGAVAVENGLVDLEAAAKGEGMDALRELEPEDYAMARIPVAFDPDADAEEWREFVGEVVETDKIQAIQQYVGYALHRGAMPFHKALLLVGSGSNGKSTFLNVVREMLGSEHTTTKPVHKFDEDNHVADLYGALANIDADLSEGSLSKEGIATFKRLVGGDQIDARRLYEDAFSFQPTAKHLYACNQVPDVRNYVDEEDIAFWRRWIVVEFPRHFPEGSDRRDPELEDRLTTDASLSGVLNWAIAGWADLHETGGFAGVEHYGETRDMWLSWGESIDSFISECVERDPDADRLTTTEAHNRYQAWCRANGEDAKGQQAFTEKLKQEDVGYGRHRIDGKTRRGYDALGLDGVPDPDGQGQEQADGSADEAQATLD